MQHKLLYSLLQKEGRLVVKFNQGEASGELTLSDNGYSILFCTSESTNLESKIIACSSNKNGLEQLVISLGGMTGFSFSTKPGEARYKYIVKYARYCDSHHILSQEWDLTLVKLIYPQTLHSVFLAPRYSSLRDINCGDDITMNARPISLTDLSLGFNIYGALFSFEGDNCSIISYGKLRKIVNKLDAIITALGYKPIDYQGIKVANKIEAASDLDIEKHTNYLVLPTIPKYGSTDFGPYEDLRPNEIHLSNILDHFLEKDLTPLLYWRVCCIFGSKEDLFIENMFNQFFICLDSLISRMLVGDDNQTTKNKDVKKLITFLDDQKSTAEQISKSMLKYLRSPSFETTYLNRGDLSSKACKLFYSGKKPNKLPEQEQRFLKAIGPLRNSFAHGRMLEWPDILKPDEYSMFNEWLYSNIHKSILNYINLGGNPGFCSKD